MTTQLRLRRGSTAQHTAFIGALGEPTVDITTNSLVIHDGVTAGGHRAPSVYDLSLRQTVTYTPSGTGAVPRTVENKLADLVSVRDFGAVGDGVTDDTAAILAAIAYLVSIGGGALHFPNGIYLVSAELALTTQGITLVGDSRWGVLIKQTTLNARILNISGDFCDVANMSFMYSGTPTSGATAIKCTGNYYNLSHFIVRSSYVAVECTTGVGGRISDFDLFNYESAGLYVHGLNDLFVSRAIINAGDATRGALGGIRLYDKVEAFVCNDVDVLLGVYSLTVGATNDIAGSRPAYCNFTNVFLDSAALSNPIDRMVESDFVSLWVSGGRTGSGYAGMTLTNCKSLRFISPRLFNCGAEGAKVASTCNDMTFAIGKFESNSVTAGAGVSVGLSFLAGCTNFKVIGCTGKNGLFTGTQSHAIGIGAGCTNFTVTDNHVNGNATGGILDGSSASVDKHISGNIGYVTRNKGTGTVIIGQTVATITHGLAVTPNAEDIRVTMVSSPTSSGVASLWVTAIGATTFQIVTNTAVVGSNLSVAWEARVSGE